MVTLSANAARFTFAVEGTEFLVSGFHVREQISRPFLVNLDLASESEIAFDAVIGKTALLTIESSDNDRYFHGIISDFSQSGSRGRFLLYKARVVPAMALLALEQDCRIFQNMTVDAIIGQILKDAGIAADSFDFRLQSSYPQRDYCVQYRETDLDFISRLLEAEGIFYFFEHKTDTHVLVFGDGTVNYQPIDREAEVLFNPGGEMQAEEESVFEFERTRRLHTGTYALQDYLFKNPALDLGVSTADKEFDKYEVYDYPGGYQNKNDGNQLAKVRLQQALLTGDTAEGQSNIARFIPGFTFELSGHDNSGFNQEYLITELTHQGEQPQVLAEHAGGASRYGNRFSAVPSSVNIRPECRTPVPVVHGVHTAIVTGPSGEEIYTDEHGRVKVQFHWDRLGKNDEHSSCWIRVSQTWAGAGWGAMHIPRIGQEVIVDFIEGSPDRPIITGRVYHGTNTPPYPLPDEKTKSTLKSDSTLGGGGSNEIRFEDKKGSEEIYLHGQKDWTIAIDNDKNQTVGNDENVKIGNNRSITVIKDQTEVIGANMTVSVNNIKTETVTINSAETVGGAKELTIGGIYQVTVGGAHNTTVGGAKLEEVGLYKNETIGAAKTTTVAGSHSKNIGKDETVSIGKNHTVTVKGKLSSEVKKEYTLKAKKISIKAEDEIVVSTGKSQLVMKKNGSILLKGKDLAIDGSGKINIKASKNMLIKGSKIKEN